MSKNKYEYGYITLCTSTEESRFIRIKYEQNRVERLNQGKKPLSLSKFLTETILTSLDEGGAEQ